MLRCGGAVVSSCTTGPWRRSETRLPFRLYSGRSDFAHSRGLKVCCRAASESPYRILGVSPSASETDIKRAYRKLALLYHPDVNKEPDAQQRFMSIKNAYQSLVVRKCVSNCSSINQNNNVDPFAGGYSSAGWKDHDDYYNLGEIWEDIQSSFGNFFEDVRASFRNISMTKSLWEELAEIGEEFLEFLEKELNFVFENKQAAEGNGSFTSRKADTFNMANDKDREEQARKLESEINEIEEMLAKLKQDLGL